MEKTDIRIRWDRILMAFLLVWSIWSGIEVKIGGFRLWLNPLKDVFGS